MEDDVNVRIIIHKQDRIDYILSGVADFYGITIDELMSRKWLPKNTRRKRFAVKLLYDVANISFKDIANCANSNSTSAVAQLYYSISDSISPQYYGEDEVKKEYQQLLKHLKL